MNNDNLNCDHGTLNVSVIHDNYWCIFHYTFQWCGNNSKELRIFRDNQAKALNIFDLTTNTNSSLQLIQIKNLT